MNEVDPRCPHCKVLVPGWVCNDIIKEATPFFDVHEDVCVGTNLDCVCGNTMVFVLFPGKHFSITSPEEWQKLVAKHQDKHITVDATTIKTAMTIAKAIVETPMLPPYRGKASIPEYPPSVN